MMAETKPVPSFKELYKKFSLPLSGIDCGEKCGPFNDYGIPVCCDIQLVVPSAYDQRGAHQTSSTRAGFASMSRTQTLSERIQIADLPGFSIFPLSGQ